MIERDVENIHNNLDKANRLVRGIESVGGSLANTFSSEKHTGRDVHFKDRTVCCNTTLTLLTNYMGLCAKLFISWYHPELKCQLIFKSCGNYQMMTVCQLFSVQLILFIDTGSVVPALVRFSGEKFSIIQTAQKKTEKDQHYPYESIESMWIRARPLHVDVRLI